MKFKTKYNIDDELYFMQGSMPVKDKIIGFSTFMGVKKDVAGEHYVAEKISVHYHFATYLRPMHELKLFKTKEELIKSTFDNLD